MYELLKIAPGVIGKVDPKKKDTAKLLDAIFKLPDMFGGALKSSSTGTSTTTEGTGLQINPPINNEGVDQDMFSLPKNPLGIRNGIFDIFSA